jgi:anti-sigma28 factor (negative regulator of flagellin synthesis)
MSDESKLDEGTGHQDDRLRRIRKAIDKGTYFVDADKVAEAMIRARKADQQTAEPDAEEELQ